MDCHATTQGLIPGGDRVKTELHIFRKGQQMGGAVSKWRRCRWDVKHNQQTNRKHLFYELIRIRHYISFDVINVYWGH